MKLRPYRPYLLGLTGSVAMGKSATAALFAEAAVPVWDADATVHRLYSQGGKGASVLASIAPEAVTENGVDRQTLRDLIRKKPALLAQIENLVHPLVAADRKAFVASLAPGTPLAVFDVPLLYETGAESEFDGVLVVTAPADAQRQRLMARPGMDAATLAMILARQLPDAEKRRRADFVIDTSAGPDTARTAVRDIIRQIGDRQDA